jgi:hypothetical protein
MISLDTDTAQTTFTNDTDPSNEPSANGQGSQSKCEGRKYSHLCATTQLRTTPPNGSSLVALDRSGSETPKTTTTATELTIDDFTTPTEGKLEGNDWTIIVKFVSSYEKKTNREIRRSVESSRRLNFHVVVVSASWISESPSTLQLNRLGDAHKLTIFHGTQIRLFPEGSKSSCQHFRIP